MAEQTTKTNYHRVNVQCPVMFQVCCTERDLEFFKEENFDLYYTIESGPKLDRMVLSDFVESAIYNFMDAASTASLRVTVLDVDVDMHDINTVEFEQ